MQNKLMPKGCCCVQPGKREKRIGKIPMYVFSWMKYRAIFLDPGIELKETEIENTPMKKKGHDTHKRDHEHQSVERQVQRLRYASRELPNICRERRRRMPPSVQKARYEHKP